MTPYDPLFIRSFAQSKLKTSTARAEKALAHCRLCPRQCGVDRLGGETGFCKTGKLAVVSSYNAHFGEEDPLVGTRGSGTIFFTHCNLLCNFCQNYEISHLGHGHELTNSQLADIMLELQNAGCHNINLVTPSHVVPQVLGALCIAAEAGLCIPIVFNSGGYDRVETLSLLEDAIDIYMPDFKFWATDVARQTCNAPDYPQAARAALLEMHRQVGDLIVSTDGVAQRGLLVRHLVLPKGLAGTAEVMKFIVEKISAQTYVNVMAQFRPCGRADKVPALANSLSQKEFDTALAQAQDAGIQRFDNRRRKFILW